MARKDVLMGAAQRKLGEIMGNFKFIAVLILLLFQGCKTVTITDLPHVKVPPNLDRKEVEFAILHGLGAFSDAPQTSNWENISDHALDARLWTHQSLQEDNKWAEDGKWFLESAEPDVIYAGCRSGEHYLRVAMQYSKDWVDMRIIGSKNLHQSGNRIHKLALSWLNDLEVLVRAELGSFGLQKRLKAEGADKPNPS